MSELSPLFDPKNIKPIAYVISTVIILSLVASIIIMDSKSHSVMFDDVNNIIRSDTKEGVTTTLLICLIVYILLNILASLDSFKFITDIIPNYSKDFQIDVSYVNGVIEMLVFSIVIIGLNIKSNNKIIDNDHKQIRDETQEGRATIVFISFIAIIVFQLLFKFLTEKFNMGYTNVLNPITDNIFYIIVLLFSFVIWIFGGLFRSLTGSYNTTQETTKSVFNDFDSSMIPNYGMLFGMVAIVLFVLFSAAYDPKSLTTNTYAYILMILIPLLFAFFYAVPIISADNGSGVGKIAGIAMIVVIISAAIYFYINMSSTSFELTTYILSFLMLIIMQF
jgi:hypothetical protein